MADAGLDELPRAVLPLEVRPGLSSPQTRPSPGSSSARSGCPQAMRGMPISAAAFAAARSPRRSSRWVVVTWACLASRCTMAMSAPALSKSSMLARRRHARARTRSTTPPCARRSDESLSSLPAAPVTLAAYLAALADGTAGGRARRPAGIDLALAAIAGAHKAAGHPSPREVCAVRAGIRHTLGTAPRQSTPFLVPELRRAVAAQPASLLGLGDRSLLLAGWAARSAAPPSSPSMSPIWPSAQMAWRSPSAATRPTRRGAGASSRCRSAPRPRSTRSSSSSRGSLVRCRGRERRPRAPGRARRKCEHLAGQQLGADAARAK